MADKRYTFRGKAVPLFRIGGTPVAEYSGRRAGDPAVLIASSQKCKKVLGWKPCHSSIEEIIASAWKWHVSHPYGYDKK